MVKEKHLLTERTSYGDMFNTGLSYGAVAGVAGIAGDALSRFGVIPAAADTTLTTTFKLGFPMALNGVRSQANYVEMEKILAAHAEKQTNN